MDKYLKMAKEAACQAGEYLKGKIKKAEIVERKDGAVDLVTDADLGAQKLIIDIIKKNFPHHGILAEEAKEKRERKEYLWAVDPIDGTSAYSVGLPTYSSSIALLKDKEPIVGAIYIAILDEVIYGMKGYGVFSNKEKKKLKVRSVFNLQDAAIGFDPSYHNREEYLKKIAAPLSAKIRILPLIWSQAAALALVSYGILDGYVQCDTPKVWDAAAGKLLVEEAGGVITDFVGGKLDIFDIDGYLAGSKLIHQQLLNFTKV